MKKRQPPKTCSWCGARLSPDVRVAGGGPTSRYCPCGSSCFAQEQNHDDLMAEIQRQDDAKRKAA